MDAPKSEPFSAALTLDARYLAVIIAADAYTRYPEDREAFDDLCSACEQITDAELETLQGVTDD